MFEDVSFRGRSNMACPSQEDVIWIGKLGQGVYVRGRPFRIPPLSILVIWFFISATSLFGNALSNTEPTSSEIGESSCF